MDKNSNKVIASTNSCSAILTEPLYGAQSIESIQSFQKAINQDLVIARFYYKDGDKKYDPVQYKKVSQTFRTTQDLMDGVVNFIKINIERNPLKPIAEDSNVKTTPTFVLFRYGENIATLTDIKQEDVTVAKIKNFINTYFGELVYEKIKKRAEEERIKEEERCLKRMWYFYNAPYNYYPYGGYYPYYYRPYIRRPYYGPRAGVYFGVGF